MSNELTTQALQLIEKVAVKGNVSLLSSQERVSFYIELCQGMDLNPYTKPFDFLEMRNKDGSMRMTPYANKDCTDQLRRKWNVSLKIVNRELQDGVCVVTAQASMPDGRTDESIGVVSLSGTTKDGKPYKLQGDQKANKIMHAETKAKRRATLSLIGLGVLDISEISSIKDARAYSVDVTTGEVMEKPIEGAQQEYIPKDSKTSKEAPKQKEPDVSPGFDAFASAEFLIKLMVDNTASSASSALEFWAESKDDEKRLIWPLLTKEQQDWIKFINEPKKPESDYVTV